MPLASVPVPLPPDAAELRAGDVDGDGRDELIVVSRTRRPGSPDAVKLTVLHFSTDGTPSGRSTVDLGVRPALWDVDHGLWVVDGEGLARLDPATGTPTRLARFPSVVAGLGPTTPERSPFAQDLDGDGRPELLAWSAGKMLVFRADGQPFGSVPAPARGGLGVSWKAGAAATTASVSPPPVAVADLDGDGRQDLLFPNGTRLEAYYTGATAGSRAATLTLPLDLDPPDEDPKPGETRRQVSAVWLDDLDGDHKADLAVQRTVLSGSWFGATAELSWALGRGDGFGALKTLSVGAAAFGMDLLDLDGDADKDFVAPVVDVGIGTLARALVAKSVRVDLSAFRMDGGTFSAPALLRSVGFPVEAPGRFQAAFKEDVDGDRRADLVTNDGEDRVRVYRGRDGGLDATPAWDQPMRVPTGDDTLFVHDLTGDGRAEIVVWGAKEASATVLRVP